MFVHFSLNSKGPDGEDKFLKSRLKRYAIAYFIIPLNNSGKTLTYSLEELWSNHVDIFYLKLVKFPPTTGRKKTKFWQIFIQRPHLLFADNLNGHQTSLLVYNMPGLKL